jgi:AcrR family transcriptional regulator
LLGSCDATGYFPTKTALFEAVFEHAHTELMAASMVAAQDATDDLDVLARGFEAFLDAILESDIQRILIIGWPRGAGPSALHRTG